MTLADENREILEPLIGSRLVSYQQRRAWTLGKMMSRSTSSLRTGHILSQCGDGTTQAPSILTHPSGTAAVPPQHRSDSAVQRCARLRTNAGCRVGQHETLRPGHHAPAAPVRTVRVPVHHRGRDLGWVVSVGCGVRPALGLDAPMVILRVACRNIGAYREVEWRPAQGLTSLAGRNLLTDGADSNGSGKTTLLNLIPLALFGPIGADDVTAGTAGGRLG